MLKLIRLPFLNLTDTDYAALVAKGYDPHWEHQMIEAGTPPLEARKLTRLVGLVKNKSPETDEEWDEFMKVWENLQ